MTRFHSARMTGSARSLLAAAVAGALAAGVSATAVAAGPAASDNQLQEVVVTAEKRVATVQSTPISITAVSGDQLAAQGTTTLEDLAATTPGISMRTGGPGQTEFEMRGLASSGGSSPTVGFYLDEVPLSPAAASLNGRVVIDPDLFDLSRVEVLRGPQGTLYGSGSMGGTIKLVSNPPKLGKFEAAADGTVANTQGGGTNTGGSMMLNLPLADTLALRLVGTAKYTDGWINRVVIDNFPAPTTAGNPACGGLCATRGDVAGATPSQVIPRTNSNTLLSTRASLLFKPADDLSFTTAVMYQSIKADGYNQYQVPPGAGAGLNIYQPFSLKEPISDTFRSISETITWDLSFAQLTSATSYWSREEDQSQDATEALQNLFQIYDGTGKALFLPVLYTEDDISKQFSQELRLASTREGPWQWVAGAFFSDLKSTFITYNQSPAYAFLAVPDASADPQGLIYNAYNPYHLKQYAVFGDASYKFTPELKLTTGLRWYKYTTAENFSQAGIGTASGNATATTGSASNAADGFNPKVTLSYTPSGDLTLYGTIARGFRPGGVSLPVPPSVGSTSCGTPPLTYGPDSVWNYEVGEKARFLDGRLTVNADMYYIRWKDIQQIIELACGYPYTDNAGIARSYGPELELSARLTKELTVNATGTWTDSKIVSAKASTGIQNGTRVLNTPKTAASLALIYDRRVFDNWHWVSRVTDAYVGTELDIAYAPTELPAHNMVDLRTGLLNGTWSAYLFADNLTNKHAALTVNNTSFAWQVPDITRVTTNQPRTIGLDVQYKF